MKIIQADNLRQIPQHIEYLLFHGPQADCLKALAEHYPHYDPGTAYYIESQGKLLVPANYNGERVKRK